MKPAPFDYHKAESVDEALSLLAQYGEDGKLLAGGQSLVPMLNLRLTRPSVLIDINGMSKERFVDIGRKRIEIGALARHSDFEYNAPLDEKLPILGHVVKDIAHIAIRNRGTFVGSVAHNDPSAEWPLMCVLLDAEILLRTQRKKRKLSAQDFLVSYLTTALTEDEMVCGITIPTLDSDAGWAFEEFNRRRGDFAIASAAAVLEFKRGKIKSARVALGGVGYTAMRLPELEARLVGEVPGPQLWLEAGQMARTLVDPSSDLQATAEFRCHLAEQLTGKVLRRAAESAR